MFGVGVPRVLCHVWGRKPRPTQPNPTPPQDEAAAGRVAVQRLEARDGKASQDLTERHRKQVRRRGGPAARRALQQQEKTTAAAVAAAAPSATVPPSPGL
jgi:hypothetical protein